MSFAQERLWFLDRYEVLSANYNMPMVLKLRGKLNLSALEFSLNELVARHDSFRTVFDTDELGAGVQQIMNSLDIRLEVGRLVVESNSNDITDELAIEIDKEDSYSF